MSPVQVRSLTLRLLGCRLTGRTVVFEAIYRGSNPRIPVVVPVAQLAEHTVDGRAIVGSTPTGYIEFAGRWCSRLTRSALNREMVGSNPIRPVKSFPGLWASGVAAALSTLRSSGSTPTSPVKLRVVDR